uniref:Uncharacterized protein n=1 Tax=mine drainage metagenome TaxID=410659 RepID=E6QA11_9ZZZZ
MILRCIYAALPRESKAQLEVENGDDQRKKGARRKRQDGRDWLSSYHQEKGAPESD